MLMWIRCDAEFSLAAINTERPWHITNTVFNNHGFLQRDIAPGAYGGIGILFHCSVRIVDGLTRSQTPLQPITHVIWINQE